MGRGAALLSDQLTGTNEQMIRAALILALLTGLFKSAAAQDMKALAPATTESSRIISLPPGIDGYSRLVCVSLIRPHFIAGRRSHAFANQKWFKL
jgi:hypothetical protein